MSAILTYFQKFGGDWQFLELAQIVDQDDTVEIYKCDGNGCTIQAGVYLGLVHLRAHDSKRNITAEALYNQFVEDDAVQGTLHNWRTNGL